MGILPIGCHLGCPALVAPLTAPLAIGGSVLVDPTVGAVATISDIVFCGSDPSIDLRPMNS